MESLHLLFNTILGGLILLIFFYFLSKKSTGTNAGTPPKPPGSWPFIGHLQLLAGPKLPHVTLGEIADELGPVFTLQLGVNPTLVVNSREIAKELFTTNDLAISSRPQTVAIKTLGYNTAMVGFAPYGAYWRNMRKMVAVELLSNRRLELLKHVRIAEVENSIKEIYKHWLNGKDGSGRVVIELKKFFGDVTLNVILRMIAGKKYYGANAEGDEKEAAQVRNSLREFFNYLGMFVVRDAVPGLGWLDVGGHEKAMRKTAKELDSVIGRWVEEHKQKREESEEAMGGRDFMDVLLSVLRGQDLEGYDADTVSKATSLSMIAGGTDGSMATMTWAVTALLNNRHILKKAQDELTACVGRNRQVQDSDINNLVYLQAIVKETLRLYPPAPLSAPRQFIEDCNVGGYHVPKNTWLMVNLWKIQTDPSVWPDPFEFRPERFLTANKDVDVRGQHFELIPFGGGRRACPGISFALQTVHFTLASFLHAFEIGTAGDGPVDMSGSPGMTNLKATPLEVVVLPRLSSYLYE